MEDEVKGYFDIKSSILKSRTAFFYGNYLCDDNFPNCIYEGEYQDDFIDVIKSLRYLFVLNKRNMRKELNDSRYSTLDVKQNLKPSR